MATTIIMPQMGYDMREGTVVRWHKKEGEEVTRGDVLAEIETDKATVEMEAFSAGVLGKIVVEEGRTVPVGELIAVITDPGEVVPPLERLIKAGDPVSSTSRAEIAPADPTRSTDAPDGDIRATPIARRLARERGIDLVSVLGTGPGGRITESDIQGYDAGSVPKADSGSANTVELSRMRQAIARVTTQSKHDIPHFYVTADVDMTEAVSLRRQINEALPDDTRVSINDLIVKAAALALVKHPKLNASLKDDCLELHPDIDIGIAIALEQGLMVPAIGACHNRSLVDIAKASSDLIRRAQSNNLRADEYAGGTFSISNLGMFDVESFTAIILPPNSAVLAVGSVKEAPVVVGGQIIIAWLMKANLSVDHRVADGAEGAAFLMEVKAQLEHPVGLLL